MRLTILLLVLLWSLPALALPPNFVFVVFDDITACWFGSYTTDLAECTEGTVIPAATPLTPTIDALAAAGVTVGHAWAQPNCSPYRAGVLTGTLPTQNLVGHVLDVETANGRPGLRAAQPNLLRSLSDAGYRNVIQGKWHLGPAELVGGQIIHPISSGFDEGNWSMGNLAKSVTGAGSGTFYDWEKCTVDGTCAASTTYATTDVIDDAIDSMGGTKPFFLYVSLSAAHVPIKKPPDPLFTPHDDCDGDLVSADVKKICHNRMIQAVDTKLADLVAARPANTIFIVTADNGTLESVAIALGPWEAGRCKGTVGECGLWVPLIVNGPGIDSSGATTSTLVQAQDLHATILDLAGAENPGSVWDTGSMLPSTGGAEYVYRGVSFKPNLVDPAADSSRSCTYVEMFQPDETTGARTNWHETIRDSTHKLMRHRDDGEDPAEECFLVADIREAVADRITLPDASCTALGLKIDAMHSGGDPCR